MAGRMVAYFEVQNAHAELEGKLPLPRHMNGT